MSLRLVMSAARTASCMEARRICSASEKKHNNTCLSYAMREDVS